MAQFNLLPDVKLKYIKTQRLKRTVTIVSVLIAGSLLAVFVLLFLYVRVAQKQHINALTNDINSAVSTLQDKPGLDKILTIQNQLNSLPALHEQKVVSSRLADYLSKLTPNKVTISSVEADFEANTMLLKGNADSLRTVNQFIDTMKFTQYKTNTTDSQQADAFSSVVLENFTVSTATKTSTSESPATYEISLNFDPAIFAGIKEEEKKNPSDPDVILQVPRIISTRSEVETPNKLFVPQPKIEPEGGQ